MPLLKACAISSIRRAASALKPALSRPATKPSSGKRTYGRSGFPIALPIRPVASVIVRSRGPLSSRTTTPEKSALRSASAATPPMSAAAMVAILTSGSIAPPLIPCCLISPSVP